MELKEGGRGYYVDRKKKEKDYFTITAFSPKLMVIKFDRAVIDYETRSYYFECNDKYGNLKHTDRGYLSLRKDGSWLPVGRQRLYSGDQICFEDPESESDSE